MILRYCLIWSILSVLSEDDTKFKSNDDSVLIEGNIYMALFKFVFFLIIYVKIATFIKITLMLHCFRISVSFLIHTIIKSVNKLYVCVILF